MPPSLLFWFQTRLLRHVRQRCPTRKKRTTATAAQKREKVTIHFQIWKSTPEPHSAIHFRAPAWFIFRRKPTVSIVDFVYISEQKESLRDARHDTWCVMSVVEYFDWLKKKPVNQVPWTEWTIIYSKVVMLCGCHSPQTCLKKTGLYCTISLYICTRYLDVAKRVLLHLFPG